MAAVAVGGDGKPLLVGNEVRPDGGIDFRLHRLDAKGNIEPDFGVSQVTFLPGSGVATDLAIGLDNKPVALGSYTSAVGTTSLTLARYLPGPVDAPSAALDRYATNAGVTITKIAPGVLANDKDPNGLALRAELVKAPAHGTLSMKPDGSFVYTPAAGYAGLDPIPFNGA
jgi:hypothetical protein